MISEKTDSAQTREINIPSGAIRTAAKSEQVAKVIRQAIMDGDIKPGQRLFQRQLANQLGVSTTPLREALMQLEAEGFVKTTIHRGVHVAEFKHEDAEDLYRIRGALESLAVSLAMARQDSQGLQELVQKLERTHQKMKESALNSNVGGLRDANYQFHSAIYTLSDSPRLLAMIEELWTQFPWNTLWTMAGRTERSLEEHANIIEAIKQCDHDLVSRLLAKHIEGAMLALDKYWDHKGSN